MTILNKHWKNKPYRQFRYRKPFQVPTFAVTVTEQQTVPVSIPTEPAGTILHGPKTARSHQFEPG